jgi:large subunit ribosomal protein L9
MKVIILKDNTVKDVNDGYARNFLLPKGLAKVATPTELEKRDQEFKKKEADRKAQDKVDQQKAKDFQDKVITIKIDKIGDNNRLFGAITAKDIAQAAKIEKEQVLIKEPIKSSGVHTVELKFGSYHSNIQVRIEKGE